MSFPDLDGIAYRSRHNNGEICFALFDRVGPSDLEPIEAHLFETERRRINRIAKAHGAVWDPSPPLIDPGATS